MTAMDGASKNAGKICLYLLVLLFYHFCVMIFMNAVYDVGYFSQQSFIICSYEYNVTVE